MTVNAITDTEKGRTGIAPTYLHTTRQRFVDLSVITIKRKVNEFSWNYWKGRTIDQILVVIRIQIHEFLSLFYLWFLISHNWILVSGVIPCLALKLFWLTMAEVCSLWMLSSFGIIFMSYKSKFVLAVVCDTHLLCCTWGKDWWF